MAARTHTFALTKIQPPRPRAGLVERERLEARIADAALAQRLVVLSAPAGFGKTAALTRLVAQLRGQAFVAWIAADLDDDPLSLLGCLIAALEPLDPPWRTDPDALVATAGGSRADRHAVATQLLNALAACDVERGLIVFEDAHRVRDPSVFEFLDVLLERLPPQWGVVVSSRTDPPLASLPRLRAHGELAEFRQHDLRFTLAEVRSLLHTDDRPIASDVDATLERLLARTHGWAVGVRLAVEGLRAGHGTQAMVDGSARDRHVFDYLLSEVLGGLPAPLRSFLLRSSVLDELTAGRCAAVTGDAHAAEWLEEIERRGLFVSALQGHETTLRVHDLFREFLRDRLRRELPDELADLHRRAAAGETDTVRRIGLLVSAGDWSVAEATLAGEGATIVATLGAAPLLRLVDKFPPEARRTSPVLLHMGCLAAWQRWDWAAMREAAAAAGAAFARAGDARMAWRSGVYESIALLTFGLHDDAGRRLVVDPAIDLTSEDLALAALVQSYVALDSGRLADVAPSYAQVLDRLGRARDPVLWYQCVPRSLQCALPSMREASRRFAAGALAVAPEWPTPLRALALVSSAWSDLWSGRLEQALATASLAEADARWLGPPPNVRLALDSLHATLFALLGRSADSARATDDLLALFDDPEGGYRRGSPLYEFYRGFAVRLAELRGDAGLARRLAGELGDAIGAGSPVLRPVLAAQRAALRGRLARLDGRLDEARSAFVLALAHGPALAAFGEADEVRLALAKVCLDLGAVDAAVDAIEPLFAAADAEGAPGGVLTFGRAALEALADARWNGRLAPANVERLRAWAACLGAAPAAGTFESAAAAPPRDPGASLVAGEALSPRELEVLRLIAAGDSNKIIARAFDLSPHTVKRHVANILDKLAVQSRGQAAAWYAEHRAG